MFRLLRWMGGLLFIVVVVTGGLIAFGTSSAPVAHTAIKGFQSLDYSTLPPVEYYTARDGAELGFRRYPASAPLPGGPSVILIHGASDSGPSLHPLAIALQSAGVASYVPELRGHGSSSPRGDIRYRGQLQDDLIDLAGVLRSVEGKTSLRLAGFSSGGGLALKFASGAHATLFDRYLLLAPTLTIEGPTVRPVTNDSTGLRSFATPYIPRLIGLMAANAVGVHAFDDLPVLEFAVPAKSTILTQTYSLRMLNDLTPDDYLQSITEIKQPTSVIIGDADEFSVASELKKAIHSRRPFVPVRVLPGIRHLATVTDPKSLAAVVEWATSA